MHAILQHQLPLLPQKIDHPFADELRGISDILDEHEEIVVLVHHCLQSGVSEPEFGRPGLCAEQVLRGLIVKQLNGFSYAQLAFHVADSATYRAFCRIGEVDIPPSKSTWQQNIKQIDAVVLETINRILVQAACHEGIEPGTVMRFDTTVVETNIHTPSDSTLLWDTIRTLLRLMKMAYGQFGTPKIADCSTKAKRRMHAIRTCRNKERRTQLYEQLLDTTRTVIGQAQFTAWILGLRHPISSKKHKKACQLGQQLTHMSLLGELVMNQTFRRVMLGEAVPAGEKIVSVFEPHTDIIVKKHRAVEYGHKICLAVGASALITDVTIERGNPADSDLAQSMVQRHMAIMGTVPKQTAFDGGFASQKNLKAIKAMGVTDVAFNKRRGLNIADMVSSSSVYRMLYRFRAGIEGVISFLKRCLGLTRCTWKGLPSFKSYVWSSVLSANLLLMARHRLKTT